MESIATRLLITAIFGVAMAHLEGVVVVYLRKVLGIPDSGSNHEYNEQAARTILRTEKTREAATIVMLIVIGILTGATWPERAVLFLWTFAFWDLFYYVSLYILIRWPLSLKSTDVLFLIPKPWIAPVWVPIGVSSLTIIAIFIAFISGIL